jgi:apolipoprotein N-acyltransferase
MTGLRVSDSAASPASRLRTLLARFGPLLAAFGSGLLLTLAFPPVAAWPVAWIALAPLYVALSRDPRPWKAFGRGYAFGFALHFFGMDWMGEIGAVPWVVLSLIEATWFGLFAMFAAVLTARQPRAWVRPLVFAAFWVCIEYARHVGSYAFPWFVLAATQVRATALLQIIEFTGQWGLSFAIALTGGLLGESWLSLRQAKRQEAGLRAGLAVAVPLVVAFLGVYPRIKMGVRESDSQKCILALAQGSVQKAAVYNDAYRAEAMGAYDSLTRTAATAIDRPDIVIWPETVVPGYLLRDSVLYQQVTTLARDAQTPLLVGTVDINEADQELNSAILFGPDGTRLNRYDKKQVVPLGEFFPLRGLLGSVYRTYGVPNRDLTAGTLPGTLPIDGPANGPFRLGVLICYDDVFPIQARMRVREGAEVLTVLTSDQTFGTTAGPVQHADLAVLRAVETRRWVARAAATGVSEFIAPTGELASTLGTNQRGVLSRRVPLRHDVTLFVRWGDWFVGVCAAVVAAAGWISARKKVALPRITQP